MLLPIAYRINYMLNLTFQPFRNEDLNIFSEPLDSKICYPLRLKNFNYFFWAHILAFYFNTPTVASTVLSVNVNLNHILEAKSPTYGQVFSLSSDSL